MKQFLARVFSMHPRDVCLGAAALWVAIPVGVYAWVRVRHEGDTERLLAKLAGEQATALRGDVFRWLDSNVVPVTRSLASLPNDTRDLVNRHATRIENQMRAEIRHGIDATQDTVRGGLRVADNRTREALGEVHGLRGELAPVLSATARLEDRYARIPDEIQSSRSWLDIRQEIECRKIDDFGIARAGYAECVKGRVIGLLGEGIKVGGVITQNAKPIAEAARKSADSFAGILAVLQRAAEKYLDPHPKHFYDRVLGFVKFLGAVLIAALRGGAI